MCILALGGSQEVPKGASKNGSKNGGGRRRSGGAVWGRPAEYTGPGGGGGEVKTSRNRLGSGLESTTYLKTPGIRWMRRIQSLRAFRRADPEPEGRVPRDLRNRAVPESVSERPLREQLGVSWGVLGGSLRGLGGVPGGPWGVLGAPGGAFGVSTSDPAHQKYSDRHL